MIVKLEKAMKAFVLGHERKACITSRYLMLINDVFSNGQVMDNQELLIYFIKQLALNENDICILDRGGY